MVRRQKGQGQGQGQGKGEADGGQGVSGWRLDESKVGKISESPLDNLCSNPIPNQSPPTANR